MDRLLPKIMEGCLRAYGASGFDFAVTTPDDARRAEDLKTLGFKSQLPLRVIQTPIRRDLFAQAAFDNRPSTSCWNGGTSTSPAASACPRRP